MVNQSTQTRDFRVKLRSITSKDTVVFEATPAIQETQSVQYKSVNTIHAPGDVMTYGYSSSRQFSISNIRLISRTPQEALNNMKKTQILRSWGKSYFGSQSSTSINGHNGEKLGAPPEILFLYAYSRDLDQSKGTFSHKKLTNLQHIPVVLTQLTINWPDDVDYIPTMDTTNAINLYSPNDTSYTSNLNQITSLDSSGASSEPFPVIMNISISLVETHSPLEYSTFSLQQYKAGILKDF